MKRTKAFVFWQWNNYLEQQCPSNKEVLHINMDESGIELFHGDVAGNILFKKRVGAPAYEPTQKADSDSQKFALTHVAFVCNKPEVQKLLPHILMASEDAFKANLMQEYLATCPHNVYLLREKSRWNNEDKMCRILKLLSLCLASVKNKYHIILSMDTCPCHLGTRVAENSANYGFWLLYIPAKLTFLLQVLDTHLFRRYKGFIRSRYQEIRAEVPDGVLLMKHLLLILYQAITVIFEQKSWALAFLKNGCGNHQADVSKFIHRQLHLEDLPPCSALQPSEEQIKIIYPRNRTCPYRAVFRLTLRGLAALADNTQPLLAIEDEPPVMSSQTQRLVPRRPITAHGQASSSTAAPPARPALPPPTPPSASAPSESCQMVTRAKSRSLQEALTQGQPLNLPPKQNPRK